MASFLPTVNADLLEPDDARMVKSLNEFPEEMSRLSTTYPDVPTMDLARFLSGSDYVAEPAIERVAQHLEWRKKMVEGNNAEDIQDELSKGVFLQHGRDKHGHPVIWVEWRKAEASSLFGWGTSAEAIERKVKAVVAILEQAVGRMEEQKQPSPGVHRVLLVINITGVAINQVDVFLIRHYISAVQTNYPERLYRILVAPTGMLVNMFWSTISLLLNERPRHKVVFLSGLQELTAYVDADNIPPPHQASNSCPAVEVVKENVKGEEGSPPPPVAAAATQVVPAEESS